MKTKILIGFILILMISWVSASDQGLVAYWSFDSISGEVFEFDGVDDYDNNVIYIQKIQNIHKIEHYDYTA